MKSEKKLLLKITLIMIIGLFLSSCGKKKAWEGNILVITLDTTRADHIGSYGYENGSTPNIDRIASEGIRFENCYSSLPLTLPSHSNIFTGKYSIGHGVRSNGRYLLGNSEKTMAEYLTESGYNTYAVIASYVLQSKFGLNQGFKIYDDSLDSGQLHKTLISQIDAKAVYGKFENWYEKNSGNKFFAWVHFYDPHTPYTPHEEFNEEGERDHIKLYDGELSYTDKYIGKIFDKLEEKNILDNTLVILVGDHGEAFGEHLEFGSHMIFCYEANLRVPLIFHNKKLISNGRVISERVDTIDIMPTILDLTGIKIGKDIQGVTLENVLRGGKLKKERTIYIESMYGKEEFNWAPLTGIIMGDYKYISLPKAELYDIRKDPLEKDNLYRKKGPVARDMDNKLRDMILKYSTSGKDSKRDLGKDDIEHLKSLGYISSYNNKGKRNVDPKDGMVLNVKLNKIKSRFSKGELEETEKELIDIKDTELGRENFLVYRFLYEIYLKKKEDGKVMAILKEAIKRISNSTPFRVLYIKHLSDLKKYKEVVKNCNIIIKENPLHTKTYITLADTFDIIGENSNSDYNYRKALEIEPENILLQIKFSEKLLRDKKFSEVLRIYDNILKNCNVLENVDLLYNIAIFNTRYGSMSKSGEILARIIEKKPEGKYYYYYAMILSKLGNRINALRNMKIAVSQYSDQLTDEQKATAKRTIEEWE